MARMRQDRTDISNVALLKHAPCAGESAIFSSEPLPRYDATHQIVNAEAR